MSHPASLPPLFLDRCLGNITVPRILRAKGLQVITLTDHYGEKESNVPDVEWLKLVGSEGWVAFTKDGLRRKANRNSLEKYKVRCFCVVNQQIRGEEVAQRFLDNLEMIESACLKPGPFFYAVHKNRIERRL